VQRLAILLGLAVGLGLTAAYAAALVAVAWRLAGQRGPRWLGLAWLLGAVVFALLTLAKLRVQGAAINVPPQTPLDWLAVAASFGYGLVGAGLTTLSVRKRLRLSPDRRLTARTIAAGVGAFLGGILLVLLVVAVNDLAALVRQLRG